MKYFILLPAILLLAGGPTRFLAADTQDEVQSMTRFLEPGPYDDFITSRASIAMSSPDYPLTPGDRYKVNFFKDGSPLVLTLTVLPDFTIDLGELGTLDVRGMKLPEFRKIVEGRLRTDMPGSFPALSLASPGLFTFHITGEVVEKTDLVGWGLSRLSDVLKDRLTPFASLRDVEIHDADGNIRILDLFMARRAGKSEFDPYIKGGDKVLVKRTQREVTISGEVRRPGTYQLKASESLQDVIEFYGDGFTTLADQKRIHLKRPITEDSPLGESIYLIISAREDYPSPVIRHLDKIIVNSIIEKRANVFFEGAILLRPGAVNTPGETEVTNRVRYTFTPGTRISTAVMDLRDSFTQVSDLANAYIRRLDNFEKKNIPVNIENLLLRQSDTQDIALENGDFIIIPFRQFFVTVAGAVPKPGRFPYVPDRNWKYYVNLAGGIDKNRNSDDLAEITSINEKVKSKEDFIEPEDKINVATNDIVYNFSRLLSVIGHVASVVTMVLGVVVVFFF
jgi:protein involved in polysaccharide export with SLBB domain